MGTRTIEYVPEADITARIGRSSDGPSTVTSTPTIGDRFASVTRPKISPTLIWADAARTPARPTRAISVAQRQYRHADRG